MKNFKISLKSVLNIVFFVIALLLQHSFVERVSIFGIRPSLPLVVVIVTWVVNGSVFGGAAGIAAGLYQDAMTGKVLGMHALFGLYSGALAGLLSKGRKNDTLLVYVLVTYGLSAFYEVCVYVFGYTLPIIRNGGAVSAGAVYALTRVILPGAMLNTLCGLPVYMALKERKPKNDGEGIDVPSIF